MSIPRPACLLFLACTMLAPAAHAETPLTESRILAMFQQIEASVRRRDARGVAAHFAPEAVIRLVLPSPTGGRKLEMGVQQYVRMLEQGWAVAESFTYSVEDVAIQISPDGRSARISDTTVESMRIQGRTISSRTREQFSVEARGGRPLVTQLTGHVQM